MEDKDVIATALRIRRDLLDVMLLNADAEDAVQRANRIELARVNAEIARRLVE